MQTVAVIFGGRSAEHDISIITALASVIKPLELTKKYRVEAVYISKTGAWFWDDKLKDITLFRSGAIEAFMKKATPLAVRFDGGMTLTKPSGLAGKQRRQKIDIVFPAMHGTYGEDGSLMGLLEMANVPYVGCGLAASVLAMDKVLAKQIAQTQNIPTAEFVYFSKAEIEADLSAVAERVTQQLNDWPLFVKPAHTGSSIGISRVKNVTELRNGLEVAAHYDDKVLVEVAVPNLIELTLPIMGTPDKPQPALLERPLTAAEDFFDFDTKYLRGGKAKGEAKGTKGSQGYSELPAKLPSSLYAKAEQTASAVYAALGCEGLARVDLLVDEKTSQVYFNEVNPLPGSLYAHNWQRAGISGVRLVEDLIQQGLERWQKRQIQATSFSTNFLQQF